MNGILKILYFEEVSETHENLNVFCDTKAYKEYAERYEAFIKTLSEEQTDLHKQCLIAETQLIRKLLKARFKRGFKTGFHMVLEWIKKKN